MSTQGGWQVRHGWSYPRENPPNKMIREFVSG
jgi:hypothetical protein